jgi:DNA invertase Pin-like site-specific DNA recombinase
MRGRPKATLVLTETERDELLALASRPKTAQAAALRARIVLACADGLENNAVAEKLGVTKQTVGKWRSRFVAHRLEGLLDAPRSGAPRTSDDERVEAVVAKTLESVPKGATHWSTRLMASKMGMTVYAIDRLGQDALDVQSTVRRLMERSVSLEVRRLGRIAKGVGELILAVLAQVADMERQRILERTAQGRETARQALAATGLTHRGKESLGRPVNADASAVTAWRREHGKSIAETAAHFGLSPATVKRYGAA